MSKHLNRRQLLKFGAAAAAALPALQFSATKAQRTAPTPTQDPEYIIVGSGAGGGPLACNLARRGHSVLLLEAGLDDIGDSPVYSVPILSAASAPEDPRQSWPFYVRHYANAAQQSRDVLSVPSPDDGTPSVYYPRAATLGGCTAHNFLIGLKPHNSDWDTIAAITGDQSWAASNMQKYWLRMERNEYGPFMVKGPGHNANGWLGMQVADPRFAVTRDPQVVRNLVAAALQFPTPAPAQLLPALTGDFTSLLSTYATNPGLLVRDANSNAPGRDATQGLFSIPLSTHDSARNGPREFIHETIEQGYPLTVKTGAFVTRVLFQNNIDTVTTAGAAAMTPRGNSPSSADRVRGSGQLGPSAETQTSLDETGPRGFDTRLRAVGVEYIDRPHVYQADPNKVDATSAPRRVVRARREVILAGGAFNTPQLLKLSGVGPAAELQQFGIPIQVDLPGVGTNLQDRYEVTVIAQADQNFAVLNGCTFATFFPDPCLDAWTAGQDTVYNGIGLYGAGIVKSTQADLDPDLIAYGSTYYFKGYYPNYLRDVAGPDFQPHWWTWGILKGHTRDMAGTVQLRSADPLQRPKIDLHYFDEGTTANGAAEKDLEAMAEGVEWVRRTIAKANELHAGAMTEVWPGPTVQTHAQIRQWVKDQSFGHHASCSCKIGAPNDPTAVLDTDFRVRGIRGLRVVDASVFPKIPGLFIVAAVYMMSEKAVDAILANPEPEVAQLISIDELALA
jgi:choline dehydrogenase